MSEEIELNNFRRIPDVGAEVGYLIMSCSNLDCWMFPAMSLLLDGNKDAARSIMSTVSNISPKFEILCGIAEPKKDNYALAHNICALKADTQKAIQFRNYVAHGMYWFNADGEPFLTPRHFGNGKKQDISLTSEAIRHHTETIKELTRCIRVSVGPFSPEDITGY